MTGPRLDKSPGVSLLHGCTTRGDPQLAVDGFDLGSYGAWGHVEALRYLPGGELADEEAKHVELPLRELPVELALPRLAGAKPTFLALEKLGEHAGVRKSLQDVSRLGEHRPAPGSVATRGSYQRERKQPDEGWPGAQAGQSSSRRKTALQLLLGFF